MKQICFLTVLSFFLFSKLNSQTTDVVTGLNTPFELEFVGNDLYVCQDEGNKVSKINITSSSIIDIFSLSGNPNKLLANNNYLYIGATNKIYRVDLNSSNLILEDVVIIADGKYLSNFTDFAIKDNYMYISFFSEGKISKIDINTISSNYTIEDVITGLNYPAKIAFEGNDLYFTQYYSHKVSKIDITDNSQSIIDVATGIDECWNLLLNNDILYVGNSTDVYAVDLSTDIPNKKVILNDLNGVRGFSINNNDLYICLAQDNKIVKFNTSTLGVSDFEYENENSYLYPNPSNSFIQISGLNKKTEYSIINILGHKISNGTVNYNERINTQNLNNGLYFLKLKNGGVLKFIKK